MKASLTCHYWSIYLIVGLLGLRWHDGGRTLTSKLLQECIILLTQLSQLDRLIVEFFLQVVVFRLQLLHLIHQMFIVDVWGGCLGTVMFVQFLPINHNINTTRSHSAYKSLILASSRCFYSRRSMTAFLRICIFFLSVSTDCVSSIKLILLIQFYDKILVLFAAYSQPRLGEVGSLRGSNFG